MAATMPFCMRQPYRGGSWPMRPLASIRALTAMPRPIAAEEATALTRYGTSTRPRHELAGSNESRFVARDTGKRPFAPKPRSAEP